jgi:hypothetical protein
MPLLLCLTDPKKREVLLHLSREKKIEFQERIYNQHIGSFSPEPFGWLAPPSLLGAREPTLSWNQLHQQSHLCNLQSALCPRATMFAPVDNALAKPAKPL